MILQKPLERGPRSRALRDPRAVSGTSRGLDAREPVHKHSPTEESVATHFSRLSLHNDHPYCSPPGVSPPPSRPSSEVLLWRYPGSLIPEALRLLRLGDPPTSSHPATPACDGMEL